MGFHPVEDLCDGILAFSLLAKHILHTWFVVQAHRCDTSTLLTTVVLLLHHQVELVETIGPRAVFLLVIVQGLQQTDHRYAAFMFQLFHHLNLQFNDLQFTIYLASGPFSYLRIPL